MGVVAGARSMAPLAGVTSAQTKSGLVEDAIVVSAARLIANKR